MTKEAPPIFSFKEDPFINIIALMDQMVINKNLIVIKEKLTFLLFQARL
jgi:hypothetical protein